MMARIAHISDFRPAVMGALEIQVGGHKQYGRFRIGTNIALTLATSRNISSGVFCQLMTFCRRALCSSRQSGELHQTSKECWRHGLLVYPDGHKQWKLRPAKISTRPRILTAKIQQPLARAFCRARWLMR